MPRRKNKPVAEPGKVVAEWLHMIGKDRNWLAEQTGCSSRHTVDKWFGPAGHFPRDKWRIVKQMMQDVPATREVRMTLSEFERLQAAAEASRMTCHDLAVEYIRAGIARWEAAQKSGLRLVAEKIDEPED